MTAEDHSDFHQAAGDTSKQLSSVWSTFVQCQHAQFQPSSLLTLKITQSWRVSDQQPS